MKNVTVVRIQVGSHSTHNLLVVGASHDARVNFDCCSGESFGIFTLA